MKKLCRVLYHFTLLFVPVFLLTFDHKHVTQSMITELTWFLGSRTLGRDGIILLSIDIVSLSLSGALRNARSWRLCWYMQEEPYTTDVVLLSIFLQPQMLVDALVLQEMLLQYLISWKIWAYHKYTDHWIRKMWLATIFRSWIGWIRLQYQIQFDLPFVKLE